MKPKQTPQKLTPPLPGHRSGEIYIDFEDCNQDILLFCAFRYALGRQTYVVRTIADIIKANWDHMPQSRRNMFRKEIEEAIEKGYAGSVNIDVPEWLSVIHMIDTEVKE
jgi:hypothetical protein